MGAWIETKETEKEQNNTESHPTWVRGLKPKDGQQYVREYPCRTLRGCVD